MPTSRDYSPHGPFTADQLPREGRYELSNGHPMFCAPSGGRHAGGTTRGAQVIASDPAVEHAAVDAGYELDRRNVRAPDVSVSTVPEEPGWVQGAPSLAVELADVGQDEAELQEKVAELLAKGTRYIWVVRLTGPPRVEVYTPDGLVGLVRPGQSLTAPGVLQNPIPMEAFYDPAVADRVALRNHLNREGYADLDDVLRKGWERGLAEGKAEGEAEALLAVLRARGIAVDAAVEARVRGADRAALGGWITRAAVADRLQDVFDA